MQRWAMGLALLAGPAMAQEWQPLDGAGITAVLNGLVVVYADGARQDFKPDGQTICTNGRDSLGHWTLRGDLSCSVCGRPLTFGPVTLWQCRGLLSRLSRQRAAKRWVLSRPER
jgi:hypothetical protein